MINDYSNLLKTLLDDDMTNQFISDPSSKTDKLMIKVINDKLLEIINGNHLRVSYIDIIQRIMIIYSECYINDFSKEENIFSDPNLKLLKKIKEDMFKDNQELINSKEKEVKTLIESFFENIRYDDKVRNIIFKYDRFVYYKKKLSSKEFALFNDILLNNSFNNIPDSYINYYMYLVINFNYPINIDIVKVVVTNLIKNILKEFNLKYQVEFKNMKDYGMHINGKIYISNELVENFKKNIKGKCDLLITVFHEIRHAIQDISIKKANYTNYTVIKMIKDTLLAEYVSDNDFEANYSKFEFEVDAFNMELIYTYRYLKLINAKKNILKNIEKGIKPSKKSNNTNNRMINFKFLPLDIIFDIYFKDIIEFFKDTFQEDVFVSYPQLKYIYNDDGTRKGVAQLLAEQEKAKTDDKWIYDDIIFNQTLSFPEIIDLLKDDNFISKNNFKILCLLKNRIKPSFKSFVDIYRFIKGIKSINVKIIAERYRKILNMCKIDEQEVKRGR